MVVARLLVVGGVSAYGRDGGCGVRACAAHVVIASRRCWRRYETMVCKWAFLLVRYIVLDASDRQEWRSLDFGCSRLGGLGVILRSVFRRVWIFERALLAVGENQLYASTFRRVVGGANPLVWSGVGALESWWWIRLESLRGADCRGGLRERGEFGRRISLLGDCDSHKWHVRWHRGKDDAEGSEICWHRDGDRDALHLWLVSTREGNGAE